MHRVSLHHKELCTEAFQEKHTVSDLFHSGIYTPSTCRILYSNVCINNVCRVSTLVQLLALGDLLDVCTASSFPDALFSNGTSLSCTAVSAGLAACRAPYLFAAVLQQAGAGQELLPLLADPATAAFQGLSITARHNRAFHIHPFLQVTTTANFP